LSRCAEDRPLLLLIDDAHLLDPATAETLRFVARRLVADPIALLAFLRPEPDAILYATGLPTLELTGLGIDAATTLIAHEAGGASSPDSAAALHRATAGNPLALLELSQDLDSVGRLPPELPVAVPDAIARAFGGRVSTLTESAKRALLIAAIADGDLATTAQAAARLGCAIRDLVEAEAIGLLRLVGDRAEPPPTGAPRDLFDGDTRSAPRRPPRRGRWLPESSATSAPGTSAKPASARRRRSQCTWRGGRAPVRVGPSRWQSPRSPAPPNSRRSTACGPRGCRRRGVGRLAGQPRRADAVLEKAAALATDRATLAQIDELRGNLALLTGSLDAGRAMLLRASELSESSDPDATVMRLADVIYGCFYECNTASAIAAADRVERLIGDCRTDVARIRGQMVIGVARILAGGAGVHGADRA
jgi:hypothetical protein